MMQKIQRFGGAMVNAVLIFAFSGMMVGVTTLCTNQSVVGELANPDGMWYQFWSMISNGAWALFGHIPLFFAISLPIGLAKKQHARCCMEAFVLFITFHTFLNGMLSLWGSFFGVDLESGVGIANVAGINTLDMGVMGALLISGIAVWIHNRFYDTNLPDWLSIFRGSVFVFSIGFFVMIPVAFLCALIWPKVQVAIAAFQGIISNSGAVGVWIYIFLERALIPFGLHHFIYTPFLYDSAVVTNGVYAAWVADLPQLAQSSDSLVSLAPYAWPTLHGLSKIFGCLGIALAFYATAKPEKRKKAAGLLIPTTITAMMCGVTEPFEFTFLFIAPVLFLIHSLLAATMATVVYCLGIVGNFDGLISFVTENLIPLSASHGADYVKLIIIGLIFTGIYFVIFRFLIKKFDFKTPGREEEDEIKFHSKAEYKEKVADKKEGKSAEKTEDAKRALAEAILEGIGGKENIVDVTNCITRLRVNVKDVKAVKDNEYFKAIGTHGVQVYGSNVQVIIGMKVTSVREDFEALL